MYEYNAAMREHEYSSAILPGIVCLILTWKVVYPCSQTFLLQPPGYTEICTAETKECDERHPFRTSPLHTQHTLSFQHDEVRPVRSSPRAHNTAQQIPKPFRQQALCSNFPSDNLKHLRPCTRSPSECPKHRFQRTLSSRTAKFLRLASAKPYQETEICFRDHLLHSLKEAQVLRRPGLQYIVCQPSKISDCKGNQ